MAYRRVDYNNNNWRAKNGLDTEADGKWNISSIIDYDFTTQRVLVQWAKAWFSAAQSRKLMQDNLAVRTGERISTMNSNVGYPLHQVAFFPTWEPVAVVCESPIVREMVHKFHQQVQLDEVDLKLQAAQDQHLLDQEQDPSQRRVLLRDAIAEIEEEEKNWSDATTVEVPESDKENEEPPLPVAVAPVPRQPQVPTLCSAMDIHKDRVMPAEEFVGHKTAPIGVGAHDALLFILMNHILKTQERSADAYFADGDVFAAVVDLAQKAAEIIFKYHEDANGDEEQLYHIRHGLSDAQYICRDVIFKMQHWLGHISDADYTVCKFSQALTTLVRKRFVCYTGGSILSLNPARYSSLHYFQAFTVCHYTFNQ